jgi:aryl-alcohol dehydrogenase-like predicted oxidoreductase
MQDKKIIALGTAMWGWSVPENECHSMLEIFYENGGRFIDTASNYPLNGLLEHRYAAELILNNWLTVNGISDMKVIYKIGSISNQRTSENNLNPQYLEKEINRISIKSDVIKSFMIHWDNRQNHEEILETLQFLKKYCTDKQITLGFSGIKNLDALKSCLNEIGQKEFLMEVRHNFVSSDLRRHLECFDNLKPTYFAYGISAGGLKLDEADYSRNSYVKLVRDSNYHNLYMGEELKSRLEKIIQNNKSVQNIYHISMLYNYKNKNISGIIVGPSTKDQLNDIINFWSKIHNEESFDLYDL